MKKRVSGEVTSVLINNGSVLASKVRNISNISKREEPKRTSVGKGFYRDTKLRGTDWEKMYSFGINQQKWSWRYLDQDPKSNGRILILGLV